MHAFLLFATVLMGQADTFPHYDDAVQWAARARKPVVVFVNCEPRDIKGAIVCTAGGKSRIQISLPDNGTWFGEPITLPTNATDKQIQDALKGQVSRSANPFTLSRSGEVPTADDSLPDSPLGNYLKTLTPYKTATMTQHTQRRFIGVLFPSNRSNVEVKWNQPGHTLGIQGWSSTLLKSGHKPRIFLGRQEPFDSVAAVTWSREYPDGTVFADVLRNDKGTIFEVRMAEKNGDEWYRFVAYKDVSARPAGYVSPTRRQCAECHIKTATAIYDGAAVPGGDTIFSDPYDHLERGLSIQDGNGTYHPIVDSLN